MDKKFEESLKELHAKSGTEISFKTFLELYKQKRKEHQNEQFKQQVIREILLAGGLKN